MKNRTITYTNANNNSKRRKPVINTKLWFRVVVIAVLVPYMSLLVWHTRQVKSNGGGRTGDLNAPAGAGSSSSSSSWGAARPSSLRVSPAETKAIEAKHGVTLGPHTKQLPLWIQNYIAWHKSISAKYPGTELFTNPEAPKVLLRVCLGLCGGLHDRLGQLPFDLYLANQTGRFLMMKWERPRAIENFLLPNEFNWSVPTFPGFSNMTEIRAKEKFFRDYEEERPEQIFWDEHLDLAIERARSGELKDERVLRHRLLGHLEEKQLENRLLALGETDTIHWTPSYGNIFHAFFMPSPGVQERLDGVYDELSIQPGKYTAVHCRVRHPKATPANVYIKGKSASHPADKTGLPWTGGTKDFAVWIATKAVYCARSLSKDNQEPMYFFADSNDLVRYMVHELKDPEFVSGALQAKRGNNKTMTNIYGGKDILISEFDKDNNVYDAQALKVATSTNLVAREVSEENAHIDRQKGRDPPAYFSTFVDLYLAINARCVTYGIGYYALFATKISGISCKLGYMEEQWGGKEGSKRAPSCPAGLFDFLQTPGIDGDGMKEEDDNRAKRRKRRQARKDKTDQNR